MKKRNGVLAFLICASLLTGLAGCNPQNTAGNTGENATGAGVADTASGAGIDDSDSAVSRTTEVSMNDRYRFCNDYHLYTHTEKGTLEQRKFTGEKMEEFSYSGNEKEKDKYIELLAVTNEEIFYNIAVEEEKFELRCIPLEEESHRPQVDRAEKVLSGDDLPEHFLGLYADSRYIAYFTRSGKFVEYDREQKKMKTVDEKNPSNGWCSPYSADTAPQGAWGSTILLSRDKTENKGHREGLYLHDIGSGTVTKIDKTKYWKRAGGAFASQGDLLVFSGRNYNGPEPGVADDSTIYICDVRTKEKRVLVAEKQVAAELQERMPGFSFFVSKLEMAGSRLYITMYGNDGDTTCNRVLSCPLTGEGEVTYEQGLNQFLEVVEKEGDTVAYLWTFLEDRCFIYYEDEDKYVYEEEKALTEEQKEADEINEWAEWPWGYYDIYSYRFDTGEAVKLEKENPEFYVTFYNSI
ncbi:MAG: hypothetical protein J1F02_06505 [Lachnospiraceae bacterium]|nr:hypothetical protein [Lachnospiraceae bacterium]